MQKPAELRWLLDWVVMLDPRVIVEIGVDQGGTFQALEAACPCADLIGIDIGCGRWSSGNSLHDGRVILGDSHAPGTVAELSNRLGGRPVDFLLIDGDHSYDGVAQDYWTYTPSVREGGYIALHDIAEHAPASGVHVAAFWRAVKHRHPDAVEFIDDPATWGGFAVFKGGA